MSAVDQLSGSTALVTGASGFIGSHLTRRLLAEGASVHAVSRAFQSPGAESLRWWQADLGEAGAVGELVRATRPDFIFHLASHVAGARDLAKVLPTFHDNLASTVYLLSAAAEVGCQRIVLANSSEEPLSLDDTVPCSPYAAAKWASGAYGRMFHKLFGTPVVIPRIFMTYGPDQKDLQKLVPFVTLALLSGETPKLSSGRRLADWVYVDDVVEGLILAATVEGIEGSTFDLGTGRLSSIRDVVSTLVEVTGSKVVPGFGALPERPLEQERAADTAFLRERLNWQPRTELHDGLAATVEWYQRQYAGAARTS
jgi:UDP-glucose 4-epimerase